MGNKISPEYMDIQQHSSSLDISEYVRLPNITFNYYDWKAPLITFDGFHVRITDIDDTKNICSLTIDKNQYNLKEIILYSPSEHTYNGNHFNTELQLVHETTNKDNKYIPYATVSILINRPNSQQQQTKSFWEYLIDAEEFNIAEKIYENIGKSYRYGSSKNLKTFNVENIANMISKSQEIEKYTCIREYTTNSNYTTKVFFIVAKVPYHDSDFGKTLRNKIIKL